MPPIYSQARADLYNQSYGLQPDTLIDTSDMLPHLADMLRTRICPGEPIPEAFTARQIVDYLAPTFEEARNLALFREASLRHCLDLQDKRVKYIKDSDLCVEVVDYLYDLLPPQTTSNCYNVWHVICALRPDFDELREEAKRKSHERLPRWQRVIQTSKKKLGGDDDFPF